MGAWRKDAQKLTFGDRLKMWDNSADDSVATFNTIFDQIQGGDQTDRIEILEPFTHLGRIVHRHFSDGFVREYCYLFDNEYDNTYQLGNRRAFDIYDRETGRFIYTYRKVETLANEYGVNKGTVDAWIREEQVPGPTVKIIVKARYI